MPLSAGDKLGPYEVLASIGTGGMGEVYRARDTRLNRDVAIKTLLAAFADDANRVVENGVKDLLSEFLMRETSAKLHYNSKCLAADAS
jgi:serine/threonine protein kinase